VRRTTRAAAVLIGVAALGLAAGCAGDEGDTGGGDSTDGSGGGDEQITLSVATFNEFGYADLYEQYMDENPNITIEEVKADTADNARDALRNSLGAGSGASDIEAVEVDWMVEFMQYADKFADLSSPDVEGRWLDWKTEAATTEDGQLVGYGTDIGPEAICYRADLVEAAGFPSDPEGFAEWIGDDWDSYFAAGKEFVAKSDAAWYDSAGALWQGLSNQMEVPYETPEGEIVATTNPEVREAYDTVLAASVDDELSAHLAQWQADWTASFQGDSFATMLCPGWMLGIIAGQAEGIEGWDIANTFPGGGGNWGGAYLTVPAQGEHIEEATALANWLTSPETQVQAWLGGGGFPSQPSAWEQPELLDITSDFFNGAPIGTIYVDRADAVTFQPYKGPNYFAINSAIQDAITRVDVDQSTDPDASWDQFVSDVEALG